MSQIYTYLFRLPFTANSSFEVRLVSYWIFKCDSVMVPTVNLFFPFFRHTGCCAYMWMNIVFQYPKASKVNIIKTALYVPNVQKSKLGDVNFTTSARTQQPNNKKYNTTVNLTLILSTYEYDVGLRILKLVIIQSWLYVGRYYYYKACITSYS